MQQVQAIDVRGGDVIPGLDNAYVVETEVNEGYFSYPGGGRYSTAMPMDTVLITYHDADGEECYLMLPSASFLTVQR